MPNMIALIAALLLGSGDDVTVPKIESLKTLIKPRVEETKWEEIPWRVDLWDARRDAARLGKPIMLWEMDGNPMGCG
jgi:hypothetical protein